MLESPRDVSANFEFFHLVVDERDDFSRVLFPVFFLRGHGLADTLVFTRLGEFKRQVLKLNRYPVHSEAVSKRRVNFHRFNGNSFLFVLRQILKRSHVVQPVGEFYQYDPYVLGSGEYQLAETLGLFFHIGDMGKAAYFRGGVDEKSYLASEIPFDLLASSKSVLYCVVKKPRDYGGNVKF